MRLFIKIIWSLVFFFVEYCYKLEKSFHVQRRRSNIFCLLSGNISKQPTLKLPLMTVLEIMLLRNMMMMMLMLIRMRMTTYRLIAYYQALNTNM